MVKPVDEEYLSVSLNPEVFEKPTDALKSDDPENPLEFVSLLVTENIPECVNKVDFVYAWVLEKPFDGLKIDDEEKPMDFESILVLWNMPE